MSTPCTTSGCALNNGHAGPCCLEPALLSDALAAAIAERDALNQATALDLVRMIRATEVIERLMRENAALLPIVQSLADEDADGLDRSQWRREAVRAVLAKIGGAQ